MSCDTAPDCPSPACPLRKPPPDETSPGCVVAIGMMFVFFGWVAYLLFR